MDNAQARVTGIQVDLGARTNTAGSSLASLFTPESQAEGKRVLKCDTEATRDAIFNKLNTWLASHSINTFARLRQAPLGVSLDFNAPLNDEQYHALVSRRKAEAEAAAKTAQQLEAEKESKAMYQMRREWDEHRNRRQRMEEEARTQAAQEARRIREEQKAIRKKQREAAMRLAGAFVCALRLLDFLLT